MTFIQTIEFTTTRLSEIQDLMDEWRAKSAGRRTPPRATLVADQDRPNTYLQIVEFPSYEEAMRNSALPETTEFAEKAAKLVDGGPVYRNLDVQRVDDLSRPGSDPVAGVSRKSFASPDETRAPDKTRLDVVSLGATKVARMTLEPGWRWSECIKPVAGTETCQARHVGTLISGRLHVKHSDGGELDLGAGDAYVIEPGHDAWVTSDEPAVGYEFEAVTAQTYATMPG